MSLSIPSLRTCLEYLHDFPCISATFAATHVSELTQKLKEIAQTRFTEAAEPPASPTPPAEVSENVKCLLKSSSQAIITYLALQALAPISLYINTVVGAGKIGLGLIQATGSQPNEQPYKAAQSLVEKGAFHIATGLADFCIGRYKLLSAGLAFAQGFAPQYTQTLIEREFIWKGDLQAADTDTVGIERDRANHSCLQGIADKVQRFILPDQGAGRLAIFFNELQPTLPEG